MQTNINLLTFFNFAKLSQTLYLSHFPQQFLYFLPEPQVLPNPIFIVFMVLLELLVFQGKSGSEVSDIYGIYSTMITINISSNGNKMGTLCSFVH